MAAKIPEHILARDGDSADDFKAQQDRLAQYVLDQQTKDIENHANGGSK